MLILLTLLMAAGPARASDLLVPTFSLEPGSETAGAEILYSAVLEALKAREIEFLDADDIAEFAGNEGLNCAARPECPGALWEKVQGTLALTATVGLKGETLTVLVEFHRPGKKEAVEFVQDELPAANAGDLAMDLALITQDLLNANPDEALVLTPVPAAAGEGDPLGEMGAGAALLAGSVASAPAAAPAAPAAPAASEAPAPLPDAAPAAPVEVASVVEPLAEPEQAPPVSAYDSAATASSLGVTRGAFASYEDSGLSPEAWAAAMKVRSRRFFLELHAGMVMGDVKRRYATRVAIQQEGETRFRPLGYYERDVLLTGGAFSTGIALGYTPAWWIEGGLLFGVEFPRKELITGWEAYGPEDDYATRDPGSEDQVVYQPATALTILLEPRLRLLMRSTGLVKPYLLGGYSMRFYDGYDTEDLPQVAFPNRSGFVSSGPMAGLGLSYDPQHKSSGFIEASGIKFLTPEEVDQGEQYVSRIPREEEGTGYAISIRAGVTTRF